MTRWLSRGAPLALAGVAFAACNGEIRFDEPPPDGGLASSEAGADGGVAGPTGPACTADAMCASLGYKCSVAEGRCVACLSNSDCERSALPFCDRSLHVCVACNEPSDCSGGDDFRCDVVSHRCLRSCHDDPCPSGLVCDPTTRFCIECSSDANCAGATTGKRCDASIGRCVECAGNAQCPVERPACDRRIGRCVACVSSAECPAGAACDATSNTCVLP